MTLIDGSWNPGEGGPVTTKLNPLHRPFGVDFDSNGRMWIVELEGGRVHRLTNNAPTSPEMAVKVTRETEGRFAKRRLMAHNTFAPTRAVMCLSPMT